MKFTRTTRTHHMPPVKFTKSGAITVQCRAFEEPEGLRNSGNIAIEIVVSDTGCGIPPDKLESIFREFEQVEAVPPPPPPPAQSKGLGMSLPADIAGQTLILYF